MKIAVFSSKKYEIDCLNASNNNKHQFSFFDVPLNEVNAHLSKGHDVVCIFVNDDASASVLKRLKDYNVNYIAVRAAGTDQTDIKTATQLGIKVANVPGYSPYAIAEHAVALMLSLNRKVVIADRKVKMNNFLLDDLIGFDMNGKTVGVIGLGKIGGIVCKILHGFGCKILGFDIAPNEEYSTKFGVRYVSLNELYKHSDIISIHAPLNDHTKYMINKDTLSLMKDGVMIVNTGRGGLINTIDAIEALKRGKIGYLGIDVYEKEKGLFFYDHSNNILADDIFARLMAFKNVLITGHQAFLTQTALKNIADTTIYNLDCWANKQSSENELA
ncbi:MAG: 2-hydroxyacid dehydrogenase [Cytophagaceae bacterium]